MDAITLPTLAHELLTAAHAASSGRASRVVTGDRGSTMRQVVMALTTGASLSEHDNPGEASLQILQGRVRFETADADVEELDGGNLLQVPTARHAVHALSDAVVLLTVVRH